MEFMVLAGASYLMTATTAFTLNIKQNYFQAV